MDVFPSRQGRIEVICGPMYSGKTEEMMRRLRRALYASQKVLLLTRDTRYGKGSVRTHNGSRMDSAYVERAEDVLKMDLSGVQVVGLDEGQFMGDKLMETCQKLANRNIRVVVAGLDLDYREAVFENMATLMGYAEYVDKLSAICVDCGEPATRSFRLVCSEERFLEGDKDEYIPVCRHHYLERSNSTS